MDGIKAKLDNQQVYIEIKYRKLNIKNESIHESIPLTDVQSLQTKNDEDRFLLKIKLKTKNLILEFSNFNVRDLCKSLLLANINDTGTYREIDYDTTKFINSLSPPLLSIFSDMNCTVSQFYNYLMQSNFYDIRNKPTSIDRLITEKLRDFKYTGDNSLLRINNYSLLMMNEETSNKTYNTLPSKDIKFDPIYDVEIDDMQDVEDNLDLEVEDTCTDLNIDKKDLKKIVDLSKKVFKKMDLDEDSLRFIERYKDVKYLKRILPTFFMD